MEEKNTNATKRRNPVTWVPSVYFAMGLPFVVLNMVTVLMFKGLDISDAQIALWTSVIMLPWTLKPLWSPFLEMYRTKKFFVVLTQLLSGCLFGLVALALNLPSFFALSIALLGIIALSGATHDVATDGVYMKELSPEDQAKYIGWQGAFYNLAKIVATGGLVYLAGYMMQYFTGIGLEKEAVIYAWMIVMLLCGTIMILLGFYHMKMLPSGGKAATREHSLKESMAELWLVFKEFFTKKYIVWYICFIILYRFAEGFVIKIVPLFLKAPIADQGLGLTEQELVCIMVRLGRRRSCWVLCLVDIISRPRDCERYCLRFVVVSIYRFWYTRSWRVSSLIMVSLSLPPSYSSILAMDSVSWA